METDIKLFTVEEVAELLHQNKRTILNWIRANKLKANKVGRIWLIKKDNLTEFLNTSENTKKDI